MTAYATFGSFLTRSMMALVPIALGVVLVVYYAFARSRRSGWLLFYAAVCLGLGFLGSRGLINQVLGHRSITTIDANQVFSVTVSGKTFTDKNAVASIVLALRSSSWFVPSHTSIQDVGDIEIRNENGRIIRYQIGRLHDGREFLIHDSGFAFQDVNKDLVDVLKKLP